MYSVVWLRGSSQIKQITKHTHCILWTHKVSSRGVLRVRTVESAEADSLLLALSASEVMQDKFRSARLCALTGFMEMTDLNTLPLKRFLSAIPVTERKCVLN